MNVEVICNTLFSSTTNLLIPETQPNKGVWIVDCGDSEKVIEALEFLGQTLGGILLTHGHFDHIYGINRLMQFYKGCKVYTNNIGREMLLDARKNMSYYYDNPTVISDSDNILTLDDGDEVDVGDGLTAKAVFTPGHHPSCITWLIADTIFTGDSYIPGLKTVTNLPKGNKEQAEESIALIKNIAVGKTIYPGHITLS